MAEYLPTEPYRGTRDFLPEEMSVRQQVFHRLYEAVEAFGYQRYDGPLLEATEIYEAKSSEEIVAQQLYTLTDRGDRRLSLRPEMTPSVARMIAGNMGQLTFPVRWYSHPNCFRYERPQRGRVREHWQLNVDLFGSASSAVEVEFIDLVHTIMSGLGAAPDMYVIRMSDRVLMDAIFTEVLELRADQKRQVAGLLDRWEKYPEDKLRADAADAGLTDAQFVRLGEIVQAGPEVIGELSAGARASSKLVEVMNTAAGDHIQVDPLIVRGFDYYTSTVFEVFDTDPANRRSLFGGGRYDNLVGTFSSQSVPGFGFGMGDVTIMDFLATHGLLPEPNTSVDAVVIPTAEEFFSVARTAAASLRQAGVQVTTPLEVRKLGKEIGRASKAGARVVVIVGEQDWQSGELTVRDLVTGEQVQARPNDVADVVQKVLARHGEQVGTLPVRRIKTM